MADEGLRQIEERLKRNKEALRRTRKLMSDLENFEAHQTLEKSRDQRRDDA